MAGKRKILPGEPGHLNDARIKEMIKVIISLAIVLIIFFTGLIITKTRNSWFTLIAVLGCLPLARYAVNWIVRIPYRSVDDAFASELLQIAGDMPMLFDMVFTNKDKNHAVACLAISDNTICGYSDNEKTIPEKADKYLTKFLHDEGYKKVSVKIYRNLDDYKARVAEMKSHYYADEKQAAKEERIAHSLLCVSL